MQRCETCVHWRICSSDNDFVNGLCPEYLHQSQVATSLSWDKYADILDSMFYLKVELRNMSNNEHVESAKAHLERAEELLRGL